MSKHILVMDLYQIQEEHIWRTSIHFLQRYQSLRHQFGSNARQNFQSIRSQLIPHLTKLFADKPFGTFGAVKPLISSIG
jgi:hypothetical protein